MRQQRRRRAAVKAGDAPVLPRFPRGPVPPHRHWHSVPAPHLVQTLRRGASPPMSGSTSTRRRQSARLERFLPMLLVCLKRALEGNPPIPPASTVAPATMTPSGKAQRG